MREMEGGVRSILYLMFLLLLSLEERKSRSLLHPPHFPSQDGWTEFMIFFAGSGRGSCYRQKTEDIFFLGTAGSITPPPSLPPLALLVPMEEEERLVGP